MKKDKEERGRKTFSDSGCLRLDFSSASIAFWPVVFSPAVRGSESFHKEKDRHLLMDERIAGPYAFAKSL
ncbi:hypothetical protein [uncultured Allobaculum sp.]|uniref:hypothetical protein n=1 Tax=Allobaculum sp. TaxID=1872463 RepID=UPI0025861159|nr:hypothetical protein [uncultured Allobaculum sp.]